MGWLKTMIMKILKIQPADSTKTITIKEPLSHRTNVLKNRLWYRGDPSELDQFYKQVAQDIVGLARFWAAVPSANLQIRKIHSGLPAMIVDRLADIVISDLASIDLEAEADQELWDAISEDNDFPRLLGEAIADTLIDGDGAFKVSVDTELSEYPLIEFYSGDQVEYKRNRGRLQEIVFVTDYMVTDDKDQESYDPYRYERQKEYRLQETYGPGYVTYKLFNDKGKEVPLSTVPELAGLADVTFTGDFIMAVPLQFFKSPKWPGRGKSIFDSKTDVFDGLDEVISQWVDAIRAGRIMKYIPEDMIPQDKKTGALMRPNPFDNQFIKLKPVLAEKDKGQIDVVQPEIAYEAFVASYANKLDMCLQGIISPATLGLDLKKLDNAEAQREKEKATLYTRGKIIDVLNQAVPQLVDVVLKVYDNMKTRAPKDYVASITFGEYAAPDFGSVVEVVARARMTGIMSLEKAVEELYGDRMTDEEKAEEILRLKAEQGLYQADEPKTGDDANQEGDEGEGEEGEEGEGDE